MKIARCDGSRQPGAACFKLITTFTLPACSRCTTRIRLVKVVLLSTFAVLVSVNVLLSKPDAPHDAPIGLGIAGLILSVMLISFNAFDPVMWYRGRFLFANEEYLQLFREANPTISAAEIPRHEDGILIVVALVLLVSFTVTGGIAVISLQERLAPSGAFLVGQTPAGWMMLLSAVVVLIMGPVAVLAMYVADRIHHSLNIAPADPLLAHVRAAARTVSTSWRVTGAIAAACLVATAATGFGSYFYLTEGELAVRAPLEASLRRYRWDDVAAVSIRCRSFGKGPRLRYVLQMSDGQDIDLDRVPPRRLAAVFEQMTSRLDALSGVRYEFDVSERALAEFGAKHGTGFENAIRSQVLRHGGVLQR